MKKDNLLLSTDFNEDDNQYWYIYDYKTLDIKTFDSEEDAQKFFDSIVA
jgi:hypothetical protein